MLHGIVTGYKGGDTTFIFVQDGDRDLYNGHSIGLVGDFDSPAIALSDQQVPPRCHWLGPIPGTAETSSTTERYEMELKIAGRSAAEQHALFFLIPCPQFLNTGPGFRPPTIQAQTTCAQIAEDDLVVDQFILESAAFKTRLIEQSKPFHHVEPNYRGCADECPFERCASGQLDHHRAVWCHC